MSDCGDHCITCSDEGIPMRVERIDGSRGLALCAAEDGSKSTVEIALVEPVEPGDRLLVHAGVALVGIGRAEPDRSREAGSRELVSGRGAGGPAGL